MKKTVALLLTALVILGIAGFLVPIFREQAGQQEEMQAKFAYYPAHYRWDGEYLTVQGAFCNENYDHHLQEMKSLILFVCDKQGNSIGLRTLDEKDLTQLRIPPRTNVAYDFTVYLNDVETDLEAAIAEGLNVTLWMDLDVGTCSGEDCPWCWPR